MIELHGCGDQSGSFPEGTEMLYQPLQAIYDGPNDCFWLIGNGKRLKLPREIRLDRKECGTDVFA